jgi:site-specific recombinase XerD
MEEKSLVTLIAEIEGALKERGQAESGIANYHHIFTVFLAFSKSYQEVCFSEEILERCLREHYHIAEPTALLSRKDSHKKRIVRAYRMLCDHAQGKSFADRYSDLAPVLLCDEFAQAVLSYCDENSKCYAKSTLYVYKQNIERFLEHIEHQGITHFSDLTIKHINKYVLSLADYKQYTVKNLLQAARRFCKFLYLNGYIETNLSEQIESAQIRRQPVLPSVWPQELVLRMLSSIDRGNPSGKRDYAILLLVTRLGIRIGDVNRLQFENLDWQKKCISFTQSKTNHPITLPLLKDVGWAIIDYVQNGRPKLDSPFIFLTHVVPIKEYSDNSHLYTTIEKHLHLAGLALTKPQKQGMHSLRHTLANRMLQNYEPLSSISAALGQKSPDSASIYLRTDIEQLRECALAPSEVGL